MMHMRERHVSNGNGDHSGNFFGEMWVTSGKNAVTTWPIVVWYSNMGGRTKISIFGVI